MEDSTFPSRVNEVVAGMSPQNVKSILGEAIRTIGNGKDNLVAETYLYNEFLDAKFIHVWYESGTVKAATDGHNVVCSLP